MTWRTGFPHNHLLRVVFRRDGYEILGGEFLTSRLGSIYVERFTRPPKDGDPNGYTGYWEHGEPPDAWMTLPAPYQPEEAQP